VASYIEDIPIPKLAQDDQLDYEGELCIVVGKTGKDIPRSEALEYIAGFVVGNDVVRLCAAPNPISDTLPNQEIVG